MAIKILEIKTLRKLLENIFVHVQQIFKRQENLVLLPKMFLGFGILLVVDFQYGVQLEFFLYQFTLDMTLFNSF